MSLSIDGAGGGGGGEGADLQQSSTPAAAAVPPATDGVDGQRLVLRASVKRAHAIMMDAVSSMPNKVFRYDLNTDNQPASAILKDTGLLDYDDLAVGGIVPYEYLKLDERHTPFDIENFKSRLRTFTIRLWPSKTDKLSSFHCARHGWRIAGENLLICVSCHRYLAIPATMSQYLSYDEWSTNLEGMIKKSGHSPDCIWIKSPSPLSILKLPNGKDMEMYMIRVAGSYKRMETLPILTDHYQSVMAILDLTGLKMKTALNLTQKLEGATQEMMEETVVFLMINGWTMESQVKDTLKCNSCQRQVPLWLCLPTPPRADIESLQSLFPLSNAYSKFPVRSSIKKFDPLLNHYFWCPWRAFLQSMERNDHSEEVIFGDESNFFAGAGMISNIRKQAEVVDYYNLGTKIDADFKAGRILMGPSDAMSNPDAAIHTMFNVKNILNSISGDASTPETRSYLKHVKFSEFQRNEIITLNPSHNTSSNLFVTNSSIPSVSLSDESKIAVLNEIARPEKNSLKETYAELKQTSAENPQSSDCVLNPIITDFQIEGEEGLNGYEGLRETAKHQNQGCEESGIAILVEDEVPRTEVKSFKNSESTEALIEIEGTGTSRSQHEDHGEDSRTELYCFEEPDSTLKPNSVGNRQNSNDLYNEMMSVELQRDDDNYNDRHQRDFEMKERDDEMGEVQESSSESDGEGEIDYGRRDESGDEVGESNSESDESDGEVIEGDGERDESGAETDESDGEVIEGDGERDESGGETDESDGEVIEGNGERDQPGGEIDEGDGERDESGDEIDEGDGERDVSVIEIDDSESERDEIDGDMDENDGEGNESDQRDDDGGERKVDMIT